MFSIFVYKYAFKYAIIAGSPPQLLRHQIWVAFLVCVGHMCGSDCMGHIVCVICVSKCVCHM